MKSRDGYHFLVDEFYPIYRDGTIFLDHRLPIRKKKFGDLFLRLKNILTFLAPPNQSCSVSKETTDVTVTRGIVWSKKV
jgi:hypothetical protein